MALSSVAWLAAAFGWFRGVRRIPVLREVARTSGPVDRHPSVSVIVPARDEEAGVREALRSILDQDYPGRLEAVGVGAFNLLGREAYLRAGTHQAIRLRPDDDMRLARLIKVSGLALSPLYAALHPFGIGVFIYAALRSAYMALARGGIEWRGTFYPLRLLKGDARSG